MSTPKGTVLVTGGSGFIGSHVVNRLLLQGYTVRTTVRKLSRKDQVLKQVIPSNQPDLASRLTFFEADLLDDKGWKEAVEGCDYILHVASPFPGSTPKDENELIRPAVDGTLRALRFAKDAKVKRVVVTSSWAAIAYGHPDYSNIVLDETFWTNTDDPTLWPYVKSKALAERAAWKFIDENPNTVELAVINPVAVMGPLLPGTTDLGTSVQIVKTLASGKMPAAPRMSMGMVDVRDVADMHILAMEKPEANGKRFLATAVKDDGTLSNLQEVGQVLGQNVRVLPDWLTRVLGWFTSEIGAVLPELGKEKKASNKQAREVLGVKFISVEDAVRATETSLREQGHL